MVLDKVVIPFYSEFQMSSQDSATSSGSSFFFPSQPDPEGDPLETREHEREQRRYWREELQRQKAENGVNGDIPGTESQEVSEVGDKGTGSQRTEREAEVKEQGTKDENVSQHDA